MSLQRSRHFAVAIALSALLLPLTAQSAVATSSVGVQPHLAPISNELAKTTSAEPKRALTPSVVIRAAPTSSREVFGFALASSLADPTFGYPSWDFNVLSTVAFFGLHVDTAGHFVGDQGWNEWNSSDLTNMVALAHQHSVKVVLTIILQDFSANTPNMCAGLVNVDATVTQTVAEVAAKHVDGVNIDYEGLDGACGTGDPYWAQHAMTAVAMKMRSALGPAPYLSIDTYSGAASDPYGFFDVVGLAAYADSFFVMAYDLEYSNYYFAPANCNRFCLGPTAPLTGYHYNDTNVMGQYVAAVPASKVILGVPYYGRKSCVADPSTPNQYPASGVVADSYLDASTEATYYEVRPGSYLSHRESNSSGQERWDTWFNMSLGCIRQLYWDDTVSLGKKYDLVNTDGLRGVGLWNLNYGGAAPELWSALSSHFVKCSAATITASPASPSGAGTKVTVTGGSSACANPQYRFWVAPPGGAWAVAQDYSATSTFSWTATTTPGTYRLEVDVRAASDVAYDSVANLTYVLGACSAATLTADHTSPQKPGGSIVLTAGATCPGTAEYRFWIRPPGEAWAIVQDYRAATTYSWSTTGIPVGSYGLEVDVRDQGSNASYETVANLAFALDPPCAAPAFSTTPPSPQGTGATVTLTASTTGCTKPQFRFWIAPPGGSWAIVQDYGAATTSAWNTSGLPSGTYRLEVDVRDQSSTASYDAVANLTDVLEACKAAALTPDKASPQPPGTTVVLTGSATCSGTPQYRFWIRPPDGSWAIVQDYSATATYGWNTTGKASGSYGLEVDVRNQGSTASYDAVANLTYLVDVCSSAKLSADKASPQPPGTTVVLTGSASCSGTAQYRFWIRPPGGSWTIVQDYGGTATYSWNTTGKPSGTYGLEVDIRNQGSTASYDTVANLTYLLGGCTSAVLSPDKASPQPPGTTVVLTGSATCSGTPEYRFWVRPPGGSWAIVQDYSGAATYSWNTTGKPSGTYGLEVDVRNQGSTVTYDTVANLTYLVDVCSGAKLTVDKASPQPPGTTVVLTGSATCSGTPQYRFWIRPPGGSWTIVQDYSGTATYSWNTTGQSAGTYGLEVDVRNQGSTATYDTVSNLTYVVGP
ncbi:MAG TPA: glycosyl hydrolase family 18 protein [Candidatus Dormibacteraeota bacterium]|nr:glycosyl hydrolase family 18 protein [Candidatus Dormibacteraeota bacterium]